jgi:ribonucleoside-diphosphate reductase alpha chain
MHEREETVSQVPFQAQKNDQQVSKNTHSPSQDDETSLFTVNKKDGEKAPFNRDKVYMTLKRACKGLEKDVIVDLVMQEVTKNLYDQASTGEVEDALVLAAISFIEKDPAYSKVGARLLLQKLSKEVFGTSTTQETYGQHYYRSFIEGIKLGVEQELMDKRLLEFDLELMASKIVTQRDDLIEYLGLFNLYERYFFKVDDRRIELPQMFWMRTAMGLAILEKENRNERAMEFYEVMSTLHYVPSTPTLLHSGGSHPQLSSCFLTTIKDDLNHIFKCFGDNAQMARWSGGIANDWTPLRATGAYIKSIKSGSQGVVPFLKVANDVNAAINRSGRRRGATVAYLETWHFDIEDFLDLRRNTGDERRRTHDMNTANWIPDLFMKRVHADKEWTLFTPNETPDLHDLYGQAFEKRYEEYEMLAAQGKIKLFKTIKATELWRKMLTRLFETGHPWITFKDPCNVRSPQDHVGVVHSSNLCTEITLNTSPEETAVCNLGSVNLGLHVVDGEFDQQLLGKTIKTAMRMLDNVIDINFYPTKEGDTSNKRHRPVGLGMMGFQDALFKMNISFSSKEALEFADRTTEMFSYYAILSSSQLAKEHGTYSSYKGSKWDRNIFPVDTLDLLEKERGIKIDVSRTEHLDWAPVRAHVKAHGMRNSNTMAIAPTATISNISGCFPCIEPIYKNLYVKANMGGEFTITNKYLVQDLKKENLWSQEMLDLIKYYDGSIEQIDAIPEHLRHKYAEAFELDPLWMVEIAASRGKWLDQSQSYNVFIRGVSGKILDSVYKKAWNLGLKCTYYLRTLGASQIEKSTLDAKKFGFTQKRSYTKVENGNGAAKDAKAIPASQVTKACSLLEPDCESCQ